MNKITSILAGLAIAATASVVPAFAQGALDTGPGGQAFNFFPTTPGKVTVSSIANIAFNPASGGAATTAAFTFNGTSLGGNLYSVDAGSLMITPTGGSKFTELGPLNFVVATLPSGNLFVGSLGATTDGASFNLVGAPVPEASTVVSFGALLALGGLAVVLRRKGGVKNAA